jgi:predicted regulator of Ras-like GTPase activity (Roadblock/LC7/MglB family)
VTVDETIRDLLSISADIHRLVLVDHDGSIVAAGPGAAGDGVPLAADRMWAAAVATSDAGAAEAAVDHVAVDLGDAGVVVLEAGGRRAVALTSPDPPLGLVLFDLRACLADAFPQTDPAPLAGGDP